MAPSFLTFFDPGQIEPAIVFSLRLGVHTLCLEQLYGCTDVYTLQTKPGTSLASEGGGF
jgi:hypothetical protein